MEEKVLSLSGAETLYDDLRSRIKVDSVNSQTGDVTLTASDIDTVGGDTIEEALADVSSLATAALPKSGGTVTGDIKLGTYNVRIVDDQDHPLVAYKNNRHVAIGNSVQRLYLVSNANDLVHDKGSYEYIILSTSNTAANPALSGGEATLTSLKLNNTLYALASGTQVTFVDWS